MARERKPRARKPAPSETATTEAREVQIAAVAAAPAQPPAQPDHDSDRSDDRRYRNRLNGPLEVCGHRLLPKAEIVLSIADMANPRIQHAIKIGVLIKV